MPDKITRMSTHGRVLGSYSIREDPGKCGASCTPFGITAGPDGNMWFTAAWRVIGRISPNGRIALFPLARHGLLNQPTVISTGQDGRLWFSEVVANRVGAVTTRGQAHEYSVSGAVGEVFPAIARGSDHDMWFTQMCESNIGRITSTGQVTSFHIPGTPRARDSWCPYFAP